MLESLTRESRHAGRDKKAHRFNGGKTGVKRPSAPGTAQRRPGENPCAVPGGLDSLSYADPPVNHPNPHDASAGRGPGETVGYHLSRPRRSGSARKAVVRG